MYINNRRRENSFEFFVDYKLLLEVLISGVSGLSISSRGEGKYGDVVVKEEKMEVFINVVGKNISFKGNVVSTWFSHETDSSHSSRSYREIASVPLTEEIAKKGEEAITQVAKSSGDSLDSIQVYHWRDMVVKPMKKMAKKF